MDFPDSHIHHGRTRTDENGNARFLGPFEIEHVVAVARKHPFYSPHHTYPPTPDEVGKILSKRFKSLSEFSLSEFPIVQKENLYNITERLLGDDSPLNTFRDNAYVSVSGGGGGTSANLAFLTDIRENRAQRAACGDLMHLLGLMTERDCVLSMHQSGRLYRSLDLTIDIVEFAGATVLPAGANMTLPELLIVCKKFKVNIIAGDTSQIVNFASFVESSDEKDNLNITKILYTSEIMNQFQETYIQSVFRKNGSTLSITSVLGSAETGVWAVSNFSLTGERKEDSSDFIFDSRHMIVECLPMDFDIAKSPHHEFVKENDKSGLLVVTSLQRLRNPLVRYFTGDVASVHLLPDTTQGKIKGNKKTEHLRILRLYGRDNKRSFNWEGEYFEFSALINAFSEPSWGILRWQIILDYDTILCSSESLEIRVMRAETEYVLEEQELVGRFMDLFYVREKVESEGLFDVKFVNADDFIRSETGNKVLMFVDRRKWKA